MDSSSRYSFVIWSFDYSWKSGGITVLHLLARLLAEKGFEVFCVAPSTIQGSGAQCVDVKAARKLARRPDVITVYPEVVKGNPLRSKRVVRWILFRPGDLGGPKKFNASELVFAYNPYFVKGTKYANCASFSLIMNPSDYFKNLNLNRNRNLILMKKGSRDFKERYRLFVEPFLGPDTSFESADHGISECNSPEEFNQFLNTADLFVSFDSDSFHSVQAALAGCTSIVVPQLGIGLDRFLANQPWLANGVAYGFEQISRGRETLPLLRKSLSNTQDSNEKEVHKFLSIVTDHFPTH